MTWWAWMLVLALPVGYLRLVAHELSHATMTLVLGGKVYWKRFRPWPHKENGKWFWGCMYREDLPGDEDDLLISAAPLGRASVGMLLWIPFAMLWTPLWVCVFWELTDVIHWWVGWFRSPTSDGGKVRAILWRRRMRKPVQEMRLSLEGSVTSRDPDNPKRITGVKLTGASLVPMDSELDPGIKLDADHLKLWEELKKREE